MANQAEYFTCRCCGMKAPIERITKEGPFEFEMWVQEYGGKRAFTSEERQARRGQRHGLGSAPGLMTWTPTQIMQRHRDAFAKRIKDISKGGGEATVNVEPIPPKPPEFDIEELKSRLSVLMDEGKKAPSIKALEKALAGVDEDRVDVSDLEDAIQEYKDVTREGLTPEEYNDEKQAAFENVQEQIDSLEAIEGDEE